jgi:hypothetical protein
MIVSCWEIEDRKGMAVLLSLDLGAPSNACVLIFNFHSLGQHEIFIV